MVCMFPHNLSTAEHGIAMFQKSFKPDRQFMKQKEFDERTLQHTFCWKDEDKNNKGNDFWPKKTQLKFNYNWVGFWTLVHGTYLARWSADGHLIAWSSRMLPNFHQFGCPVMKRGHVGKLLCLVSQCQKDTHGGNYPALMGRLLYSMDRKIKWKSSTACSDVRGGLRLSLEHYQTC